MNHYDTVKLVDHVAFDKQRYVVDHDGTRTHLAPALLHALRDPRVRDALKGLSGIPRREHDSTEGSSVQTAVIRKDPYPKPLRYFT